MSAASVRRKIVRKNGNVWMAPPEFPGILDVIRSLQKRNKTKPRAPKRGDRIGFSFSSKDRYLFTLQTLKSLDTEGGFDLIWNDGSSEPGG